MSHLPTPEGYFVTERLAAGGFPLSDPSGLTGQAPAERIARYEAIGVTTFVDLTHPSDPLPSYGSHLALARRIPHPIVDMAAPSVAQMVEILDDVDESLEDGGLTYVHCWGGIGRTGAVVGCWLVRHGLDEADPIGRIATLRRLALDSSMPSPQTTAQRDLVCSWRRGR